ncbi:class I SAM-dependent methyltransferase [Thermodesulfobacteriota bacterium]
MEKYYQQNYQTYHQQTFYIDPTSFLSPLEKRLKPGADVLDIGCGSGRDLLWFKERGYTVVGFEKSRGLAELAMKNSGCEMIEGDFETYDFSRLSVDAILLVGTLVHLPHKKFKPAFQNISNCLNASGKILVSVKEGSGLFEDTHGRIFYLWQDKDLRDIFAELGHEILDFNRQISAVRETDIWLGYVLVKKHNR